MTDPDQEAPTTAVRTTRETILAQAERIFAELGFPGASLDDIARAVGIRRPSVLHHFASKREIYDAVEASFFADLQAHIMARGQAASAMDQMHMLLGAWLDFMVARPTAARIIMRNSCDLVSRTGDPVKFSDAFLREFEEIIREGQRTGQFQPVEPMLALNILGGAILQFVCVAQQLGEERNYDPSDPATKARFRDLLEQAARALLARGQ